MNTLRKMCALAVLACLFSVSASAGEMSAGYTGPLPPPPAPTGAPTDTTEDTGEMGDSLTDLIVTVLNGLLTVL